MRPTLLCLHGWGGSAESFAALRAELAGQNLEILTPDLPGFGAQSEPPRPWTVDDYCAWVVDWLGAHRTSHGPLFLLGHSHGGRISIKLTSSGALKPERLFLCAPAINRRHRYRLRRVIGLALAKTGRALMSLPGISTLAPAGRRLLYKLMRVHDYERATPLMQKTLVLVTREDLSPLLSAINVETDLFWGNDDHQTPVSDGVFMCHVMPHARLHRYAHVRHGVHRDKAKEIAAVIVKAIA